MGHTRVIYTNSTTAECGTVLKMLGFEEDPRNGCFTSFNREDLKIYVVWGKADYYPDFFRTLSFLPRVQMHLKARENARELELMTREAVEALRELDRNTRIEIYDPAGRP